MVVVCFVFPVCHDSKMEQVPFVLHLLLPRIHRFLQAAHTYTTHNHCCCIPFCHEMLPVLEQQVSNGLVRTSTAAEDIGTAAVVEADYICCEAFTSRNAQHLSYRRCLAEPLAMVLVASTASTSNLVAARISVASTINRPLIVTCYSC